MKKQGFLTGALILMTANAVSKILGAVFKIPLTYILNEEGMAVYNVAFEVYIMFLSFIISGLPFAISKTVAAAAERGKDGAARKIVRVSALLLIAAGIIGTGALYALARFFALAMKEEKAVYAIRMISPAIFFVALGTAYKSYFQGVSNMLPVALSQVAEAVVKLAAGFALALLFIKYGAEKTAGGAITGVTAGEIVATAILIIAYLCENKRDEKECTESAREILRELMSVALPLLCASVVTNALSVVDTTLLRSRMLDGGLSGDDARFLYGAYTGYALTVFHLPVGILGTLGVSILPLIAGAAAVNDLKRASRAAEMGIRLTVILSLPCAVIMYTMSSEILNLLFHNTASALMLKAVAPCTVMLCTMQICASILQSAGKIMTPFLNALVGIVIKLVIVYFLAARPEINIYGSAIGANVSYTVVMILNLIAVRKYLGLKLDITAIIIKPAAAAAVMLAVIYLAGGWVSLHCGGIVYLAVMCTASIAAYFAALFVSGAVSVGEVKKILKA